MALLDSGATSHYVTEWAPVIDKKEASAPIQVGLPDGTQLSATKQARLPFPTLPINAQDAYVVQGIQKISFPLENSVTLDAPQRLRKMMSKFIKIMTSY